MYFKQLLNKAIHYSKLAFKVVRKYALIAFDWMKKAIKYLKTLKSQELKNYSLNLVSVVLIFTIFLTTLFSGGESIFEGFDPLGSKKIVSNIRNLELNMTSIVYAKDEDGKWQEYKRIHGDENRIWISLKKVPKNLQNAFIAIEDQDFLKHGGVDWKRTFLAVANQILKFSSVEFGGSTITQQLIKNITSDKARDYSRKIREIIRALAVETELSKDEILEAYLNTIALGSGINGVQVAANYYFSKDVDELTLAECASIAAITKNPSRYSPAINMEENTYRRKVVLTAMYEQGYISKKEYNKAYDEEVKLDFSQKENLDSEINNYFIDTLIQNVITDLAQKYNCDEKIASQMFYNGGFKIYSTVNPEIQSVMEDTYSKESRYFYETRRNEEGERERVQSAMTILDYKGHIVGIMGGAGEKTVNRGLNRAYNVPRQPGSTMKPLGVYAQVIEKDICDYTTTVLDEPIKNYYGYKKPGPKEWFGEYMGKVPLNYALRHSMNAVPVRLLDEVGINDSYKFLTKKLNLKHLVKSDKNASSLALGGCTYGITPTESAAAFAIFGNGGIYYTPTTYYKVVDISGNVILEPQKGKRAIGEDTATIMNHLLREVVYKEGGTGRTVAGYNYRMKCYAKTGTSSDTKDSWLVGGTPYYIGSVWYGFDHNYRVYNTSAAKSIWRDVMREIHEDLEIKEFEDSDDVYRKGDGYYKDGTSPGKILKEEDYLPDEEEEEKKEEEEKESKPSKPTESSKPITSSKPNTSSVISNNSSNIQSSNPSSVASSGNASSNTSSDTSTSSGSSVSSDTSSVPSEDTSASAPTESTVTSEESTSSSESSSEDTSGSPDELL
ncbi:MAG: transglycosylase domain-containing protein [Clostridia bacterium]|nr:transglycosylase domain-containing protein [Clostridia bacterium]